MQNANTGPSGQAPLGGYEILGLEPAGGSRLDGPLTLFVKDCTIEQASDERLGCILMETIAIRVLGHFDCGKTELVQKLAALTGAEGGGEWIGKPLTLIDTPGHIEYNADDLDRNLQDVDIAIFVFDSTEKI